METQEEKWFRCMYQFHPGYSAESVEQIKPWLKDVVMPEASKKLCHSIDYKILGVGSGTGVVDLCLLKLIKEQLQFCKWPKITYTVVEVDPEAVKECKTNLSTVGLDIEFKWEVMTVNQYFSKQPEQYDMIHFMYSLFIMDNPHKGIIDVLKRNYLAKDGVLFTMYHDEKQEFFGDIMFENIDAIMKVYEGGEGFDAAQSVESTQGESQNFDAELLKKVVNELGWNCRILQKFNKEYVTDIVKRTEEGVEKLGYILGCSNIQKKMPAKDLDRIINQITVKAKKENIDGKEILFGESLHYLILINKE